MKESLPKPSQEILDVKTLSADGKIRYLMKIFDLGKDPEKNEERKKNFMELIMKYNEMIQKSKLLGGDSSVYVQGRADTHNKIMDIITKMSFSQGLDKSQRMLTEYLAKDRDKVAEMISDYFSSHSTSDPRQYDEVHQALRGEGAFQFSGKEEE